MMKLAFYRADAPGKEWVDTVIDMVTGRGGYSHNELVFSDGIGFSCSPRENKCRFKTIDFEDSETWDLVELDFTEEEEEQIKVIATALVGRKYDWLGIFLHEFLPLGIQSSKRFWCTEVCLMLIRKKPFRVNPNVAAQMFNLI